MEQRQILFAFLKNDNHALILNGINRLRFLLQCCSHVLLYILVIRRFASQNIIDIKLLQKGQKSQFDNQVDK